MNTLHFCVTLIAKRSIRRLHPSGLSRFDTVARAAAVQLLLESSFIAPKLSDSSSHPLSCYLVQCFKITGKSLKEALRNQGHQVLSLSRDLHRCLVKQCKALDHRTLQQVST